MSIGTRIVINGKQWEWPREQIGYEAIAALAGYETDPDVIGEEAPTVTYRMPPDGDVRRTGFLSSWERLPCIDGTVFNCYVTS